MVRFLRLFNLCEIGPTFIRQAEEGEGLDQQQQQQDGHGSRPPSRTGSQQQLSGGGVAGSGGGPVASAHRGGEREEGEVSPGASRLEPPLPLPPPKGEEGPSKPLIRWACVCL